MSCLSLGLNLPAMFAMDPMCMFKKATFTVNQSPQAAYDDLVLRLHANQKLITGPLFLTEEVAIASPVQSELAICAPAVSTNTAHGTTSSTESSSSVTAAISLVQSHSANSRQPTNFAGRAYESDLSFCSEADQQTHPDESFQLQPDHSCLDLSFDLEASFGDYHQSVHFNHEFDLEISFQDAPYSSINDSCFLEDSLLVQSICLQTSSSTIETPSHDEIPQLSIYNQMLEDLLGFSTIHSLEPSPIPSSSLAPSFFESAAAAKGGDWIDSVSQTNFESHLENSIRSFFSRSELFFGDQNNHLDLDLIIESEASFGDQDFSVHLDNVFDPESSFEDANFLHLDGDRCVEDFFGLQETTNTSIVAPSSVEPLAEEETPHLEIYHQMLQELFGCSDLESLDSISTPSTASSSQSIPSTANPTSIKPRRRRSSGLTTLCSSTSTPSESKLGLCDPSPDPEQPTNLPQSSPDLLEKPSNSILITDEFIEVAEKQLSDHVVDQSFDNEMFLKLVNLDHSFGLDLNLDLERY